MLFALPPTDPQTAKPQLTVQSPVAVGWHDEMDLLSSWRPITSGNQPQMWLRPGGGLSLRLPQVPDGWPYEYQWSGVTREAIVDLGRYPVLMAKVDAVDPGYAHLEVEERDHAGRAVRGKRTPALTLAGIIAFDLGESAKNVRRLTLRLIVGGPNEGAMVAYRWVRFASRADAERLKANPRLRVRFDP